MSASGWIKIGFRSPTPGWELRKRQMTLESVKGVSKWDDPFGSAVRNGIAQHIRGKVYKRGNTWIAETYVGGTRVMSDNTGCWASMLQCAIEDVTVARRAYVAGYDLGKVLREQQGLTA